MALDWGVEIIEPGRETLEWYSSEAEAEKRREEVHRGRTRAYLVHASRLRDACEDEDAEVLEAA